VAGAALVLVLGGLALGAPPRKREPVEPSYTVSNIAVIVMAATALAIPCKCFRRT